MPPVVINLAYLVASVLFILGLKGLSHPRKAVRGNLTGAIGMLIAIVATMLDRAILSFEVILAGLVVGSLIGAFLAVRIHMTAMPQMVALLNGFGGAASVLVAGAALVETQSAGAAFTLQMTVATALSALIGAVTFWGSLMAYGKLQELISGNAIVFPGQHLLSAAVALASIGLSVMVVLQPDSQVYYWSLVAVASVLGVLATIGIGGADMPVVISLLNCGWHWRPRPPGSCSATIC